MRKGGGGLMYIILGAFVHFVTYVVFTFCDFVVTVELCVGLLRLHF